MPTSDPHGNLAAYALDALDEAERRSFDAHLAECTRCADELVHMQGAAASLAFATESLDPPPELRERILATALEEQPRPSVVVLRPRRRFRIAAAAAAVLALVAVGLGAWVLSLVGSLDSERSARDDHAQITAILADETASRMPLGAHGEVVRAANGEAVLVSRTLPLAPDGKTYEAWVIGGDGKPSRAGLFEGGKVEVLLLDEPVPKGAVVAVTVEPDGGLDAPTGDIVVGSHKA